MPQHAAAEGVFQAQQPRAREMRVVGLDRRLDVGQRQRAVGLVGDRLRLHAAEHRAAARLVAIGVRALADQVLVAALAMAHQRREVALRARRHEQRRLLAEHRGDALLQRVDGGVVAEHVVAQRRGHHRVAHRRRRPGDGVAAQVDRSVAITHLHRQEVAQHRMPVLRQDRLRMELHALERSPRDGARP